MGRGDKKTRKGKVRLGSFGNSRRRNKIKSRLKRRLLTSKPEAAVEAVAAPVETVEVKPKVKRVTKKKTETPE